MQRFHSIIALAILVFLTGTGCKKDLLITGPANSYTDDNFWKTPNDAVMAVNGIYSYFLEDNMARWMTQENVLTDDLAPKVEGVLDHFGGLANGTETPSGLNAYPYRFWESHYTIIVRANTFLSKAGGIQMDSTLKKRLVAEAKFLRALCYHRLVWRFGDIPLVTKHPNDEPAQPGRASRADVIQQVYSDLLSSYADLPPTYSGADKGRVTRGASLLLLAKEYLYNGDNAHAAQYAKLAWDLGEAGNYKLVSPMSDLFKPGNQNTSESLFELQSVSSKGGGYRNIPYRYPDNKTAAQYVPGGGSSIGSFDVLQSLVNDFEMADGSRFNPAGIDVTTDNNQYKNRDPRLDVAIVYNGADYYGTKWNRSWDRSGYTFRKYLVSKPDQNLFSGAGTPYSSTGLNWILFRYADVMLTYAEAQNELAGPDASVLKAVNQVRTRAGMPLLQTSDPSKPTYVASQADMRTRIRRERHVEFAGENSRFEDLLRWRLLKSALENKYLNKGADGYRISNWQEFRYLWPIPALEINTNPNLTQNPGYGS